MGRYLCVLGLAALVALAAIPVAAKQLALVIGNGKYQHTVALDNPINDAKIFAEFLRNSGYEVTTTLDATRSQMSAALSRFSQSLQPGDTAVFYYAGHGVQMGGENYLLGVEGVLASEFDVPGEAIALDAVMNLMASRARISMLFIDACRSNPLAQKLGESTRSVSRGLAAVEPQGEGSMIAFAAGPGQVAFDGDGANSPFTAALVKHLGTPGLETATAFKRVIAEVRAATGNRQSPQIVSSLAMEVFFGGAGTGAPVTVAPDLAELDYAKAQKLNTARAWQLYLAKHPDGFYADLAREALSALIDADAGSLSPEEAETALKLTPELRREIQVALNALGYSLGTADGVFGRASRREIARYQAAAGLQETGFVSAPMLTKLGISVVTDSATLVSADQAQKYDVADLEGLETDPRLLNALRCLGQRELKYGIFDGHVYIAVLSWGTTWEQSRNEAVRCGGDLVSIGSKAENDFVFELYASDERFMEVMVLWSGDTAIGGPWIGMSQDPAGREPTGGWRWSDGTPTTFTAWNDQSNSRGSEDVASYWVDQLPGRPDDITTIARTWGDIEGAARSYVMEIL